MDDVVTLNGAALSSWAVLISLALIFFLCYLLHDRALTRSHRKTSGLYARDHGKLNISLPPKTMWMNMGFWKHTNDFPTACCALLEEVLKKAWNLQDLSTGFASGRNGTCTIIDLGFGCGDQTLYFNDFMEQNSRLEDPGQRHINFQAYIGITLDADQFEICQQRLRVNSGKAAALQIYCGDAGRPESWPENLHDALNAACLSSERSQLHENWVLGLDTLYHFRPSRWHVIKYARNTFNASLMAFDLCIADSTTPWQRFLLRLLAWGASSPYSNWMTTEEYRNQLVAVGYSREKIEIYDISEHVFGPLTNFLKIREQQLNDNGLSIGRFRYAALMFSWWARSRPVNACIIIARKSG